MKNFSYADNCLFALFICFGFIVFFHFFKGSNFFNFIYAISFIMICSCMCFYGYKVEIVAVKTLKNFFTIDVTALYNFINSDASKLRAEECPRQLSAAARYSDSHMSSMSCNSNIGALYLGRGFEFTPQHTRKLHDLLSRNGLVSNEYGSAGSPQIHNLEKYNNQAIYTSAKDLTGHTIVFGTTGSGKTRAY